jgi:hypothetical protein
MTTIIYRNGGRSQSLHSGNGIFAQISAYADRLAGKWEQWRNEREIESMPFDMRKDFGWPATDIGNRRKGMQ